MQPKFTAAGKEQFFITFQDLAVAQHEPIRQHPMQLPT